MGQYRRKLKKGERWFYSGQYLGQKYFSKVIYLTKQEAKKAERAHIDGIDERMRRPKPEMTLLELCEARLDFIEQNKSNFYYVENKRFFKNIIDHCGSNRAVGDITRKEINEFLAIEAKRLKAEKKSNHKINSLIRCLKALFNYGIKSYDLEIKNPVRVFDEWEAYPRFLEEKITELKQVKWSWHNLRHRRASIWATNGLTTFEIMSRLGHSNLSTTMIYLQLLGFTRL